MIATLTGLALIAAAGGPARVSAEALPLAEGSPRLGCLAMTSAHSLSGGEGFGGYSGMVLDQEGGELLLLADNGNLIRLSITLGEDGAVTNVAGGTAFAIHDEQDRPLKKRNGDTEALTPWPGGYLITREALDDALLIKENGDHFAITETVADLSGSDALRRNGGYEAASALGEGRALFISEGTFPTGEAAITLFDGENVIDRGRYQPAEDFAVTDIVADTKGDRLFAVERAFSPSLGPRTRLTVAPLSAAVDDDAATLIPVELGRLTLEDGTDNMEGLAFYQSSDGGENLMIISDDNFNPIQRTVLMTFRLGDTCPL
ncbi:MAG: esterase-like activity of phytase family protein [Pseudomonadota bacterium]